MKTRSQINATKRAWYARNKKRVSAQVRSRYDSTKRKTWYNKDRDRERRLRIRSSIKEVLLQLFGNKCSICGYGKCQRALEFHHKNKLEKEKGIAAYTTLPAAIEESRKCILVCSNCHAEIEEGYTNFRCALLTALAETKIDLSSLQLKSEQTI